MIERWINFLSDLAPYIIVYLILVIGFVAWGKANKKSDYDHHSEKKQ